MQRKTQRIEDIEIATRLKLTHYLEAKSHLKGFQLDLAAILDKTVSPVDRLRTVSLLLQKHLMRLDDQAKHLLAGETKTGSE